MTVSITVDGRGIEAREGSTVLEACLDNEIYIPHLCFHPDLPVDTPTCGLCYVEIDGKITTSCDESVRQGMAIETDTDSVEEKRKEAMSSIFADHPHYCLTCDRREGCSPYEDECPENVDVENRCCPELGYCEIGKVAEYLGIPPGTSRYEFRDLPVLEDIFIKRDHNLCVGCTRCVRICNDVRDVGAIDYVFRGEEIVVGPKGEDLEEAGCRFCGSCVEVCPTDALSDIGIERARREEQLVPCKHACPADVDVPNFIRLLREEKYDEALALVMNQAPLPTVLGHACTHPCEDECRRGDLSDPMAICDLKRFIAEHGELKDGISPEESGKKVAVVGSGPAGLTLSYFLARKGHAVTIFEAEEEMGGMMRIGIPQFRLPREVVDKDIERILQYDIDTKVGTRVGDDIKLSDLMDEYDSLFIATGAHKSKTLPTEGIELDGIFYGTNFLRNSALNEDVEDFDGKRVVVIGGGDVAMDAARTSTRLGAERVDVACLEVEEEMPAHEWESDYALEEGINLHDGWGPRRIDGNGTVEGIELVRCVSVFDEEGRFNPSFDEDTTKYLEADAIIVSIGQDPDLSFLDNEIETDDGTIRVDEDYETNAEGVFAAGEATSPGLSIVESIKMGKRVASSIDKYLGGDGQIPESSFELGEPDKRLGEAEGFARWKRKEMPKRPVDGRTNDFEVVEEGFGVEDALAESERCLQCDLRFYISPPILPPEVFLEFTEEEVDKVPDSDGVYQLFDEDKEIVFINGASNMRESMKEDLEEKEDVSCFRFEEESMYTQRQNEMVQKYSDEHGELPKYNGGGGLGEDLF